VSGGEGFPVITYVCDRASTPRRMGAGGVAPGQLAQTQWGPKPMCTWGVAQLSSARLWPSQPSLEIKQSPGRTLPNCLLGQWEVGELRVGFKHFGGRQDSGLECGIAYLSRRTADGVLLTARHPCKRMELALESSLHKPIRIHGWGLGGTGGRCSERCRARCARRRGSSSPAPCPPPRWLRPCPPRWPPLDPPADPHETNATVEVKNVLYSRKRAEIESNQGRMLAS